MKKLPHYIVMIIAWAVVMSSTVAHTEELNTLENTLYTIEEAIEMVKELAPTEHTQSFTIGDNEITCKGKVSIKKIYITFELEF